MATNPIIIHLEGHEALGPTSHPGWWPRSRSGCRMASRASSQKSRGGRPTSYLLLSTSSLLPPTSYRLPPTSTFSLLPPTSYLLPPTSSLLPPPSYLLVPGFPNHPRGTWLGSLPAFIPRPAPLQACSAAPTPTRSDPRQPKQQASSKDPRRDRRRDGRGCERKPQAPTGFVTARGALRPPPWRENRETEAGDRERKRVSVDLCCVALLLPVACVILRPSHCGSVALLPYCFAALVVQ